MTWDDRELPILQTVHAIEEHPEKKDHNVALLAQEIGMDAERVRVGVKRLIRADYLTGMDISSASNADFMLMRLTEKGLREVGDWPSKDELVQALASAMLEVADAVEDTDADEADRLRKGGNALLGAAREVALRVATSVATSGVMGAF